MADASSHGSDQFNMVVRDSEPFVNFDPIQLRTTIDVLRKHL